MRNGELWLVNFEPSIGDEIQKTRLAIIVSDSEIGALQLSIVVPITEAGHGLRPWHVKVKRSPANGLKKDSVADCFQIKSISRKRFHKKIGTLSTKDMDDVKLGIIKTLDLI